MTGILVVRLRGDIHLNHGTEATFRFLNLGAVNHATIVPDTPEYKGMLNRVRDHCTFGPADAATVERLLKERGRALGDKPLTDAVLAECSEFKSLSDYAKALAEGKASLGIRAPVAGSKTRKEWAVRPVMRLAPPRKGHEGIKHGFRSGGALGDRGAAIDAFVERMV